jgi:MHS family proline/betaine transporter-like MFS transporter
MRMSESPLFAKIKAEGKTSVNPIKESFGKKENLKLVLIALFGATAGQGVVWYTGQFYALSFLQKTCQLEYVQSNYIMAIALVLGTPLFIVFGAWSDRVGRKFIMLTGMLLAVVLYQPIYQKMFALANVAVKTEIKAQEQIERSMSMEGSDTLRAVKNTRFFDDATQRIEVTKTKNSIVTSVKTEVVLSGSNYGWMIGLVFIQIVLVTMVYGPIAAFLVELFPTRIRYTSMSLPYHIGNGIFGGLTPFIATLLYSRTISSANPLGDPFAGLWYPIVVAAVCFVIGMIFLSNKKKAEVE